jgi:hypothetical protein
LEHLIAQWQDSCNTIVLYIFKKTKLDLILLMFIQYFIWTSNMVRQTEFSETENYRKSVSYHVEYYEPVAPYFTSVLLYFLVLRDHWCQHYKVLRIEYRSAGARGREGCCSDVALIHLSLMYRLNKTESALLMFFCCD